MKRLNIQLTEGDHAKLKAISDGDFRTMKRQAELYISRGMDGDDAQAEIDTLVTAANALVNALPDCTLEWAQSGGLDNTNTAVIVNWREKVRTALKPFKEASDD